MMQTPARLGCFLDSHWHSRLNFEESLIFFNDLLRLILLIFEMNVQVINNSKVG